MKKIKFLCLALALIFCNFSVNAQSNEAKELMLNVEKLNQLKNILKDMKKGYTILENGYNTVKDIAEGNFKLHQLFLDGLLQVSPAVKKYERIAQIISFHKMVLAECKNASTAFTNAAVFTPNELDYQSAVYQNLLTQSLQNLEELTLVISAGKLRMSDDERLQGIDKIFIVSQDQLSFLRDFNQQVKLLLTQKIKEKREILTLKSLNQINK